MCRAFMLHKFYFSSSSVVSRAFSALCARYAYIRRSGIIITPYATSVPNFVSVALSTAELALGEKSHTQSITHSLNHPAYLCAVNRSFHFGITLHATETANVKSTSLPVTLLLLLLLLHCVPKNPTPSR